MTYTIKKEGNDILVRFPKEDLHGLRVALEECPCRNTKSNATMAIRKRLANGLAQVAGKT